MADGVTMVDDSDAPVLVTEAEFKTGYRREEDGIAQMVPNSYYRGERPNFRAIEKHLDRTYFIKDYVAKDVLPEAPRFSKTSGVVAFGSCFAHHIGHYLSGRGYNVLTRKAERAYVNKMGDGIVNTFAIRQQFEWAWNNWKPDVDLWRGYDAAILGYDEEVRLETRRIFDEADAFVITLGLSEIWYDEPTGEVFWRAVPTKSFDPARHKFRLSTVQENYENLKAIRDLIRKHRPGATIVFTLSPIPLAATFRKLPCMVADSESKAILRVALGQLMRESEGGPESQDRDVFYMPSYEIAQRCFNNTYIEDLSHVHRHIVDFIMLVFERYFCDVGVTDAEVHERFQAARKLDRRVGQFGHGAAPSYKSDEAFVPPTTAPSDATKEEVLVAGDGATIFDDSRAVTIRRPGQTDGVNTSVVVFPDAGTAREAYLRLPGVVQRGVTKGRVGLVFDGSGQAAPHRQERTDELHAFAREIGQRLSQCVYITPDHGYPADYAAYCDTVGLASKERMSVLTYDQGIRRFFLDREADGGDLFAARLERFKARPPTRSRAFRSVNPETMAVLSQQLGGWAGFAALAGGSASYDDSWFSVVAEPQMLRRPSRVSEAVLEPLVNFHPLLLLGDAKGLDLVRELGFQTFEGFVNEAYDCEPDPLRRSERVLEEVRRLSALGDAALGRLEQGIAEVLIHNAQVGLEKLPRRYRDKIDERVLLNTLRLARINPRR